MSKVTYTRDEVDTILEQGMNEKTGTLKLRLQPSILVDGQYLSWSGVSWIVECDSPEEAMALRELLKRVFAVWSRQGTEAMQQALDTI